MAVPAETISQAVEFVSQNWEWAVGFSSFLVIGAIGLTFKQRLAIRERDDQRCQSKDKRIGHGGRLEVDHIIAKEFAEQALKMDPHNHGHLGYNDPPNLLTKCDNHHKGHPNSHHPDVHKAMYDYRDGDKDAIANAIKGHESKAKAGQVYWNNENDGIDRNTAIDKSLVMDRKRGGRRKWWPW